MERNSSWKFCYSDLSRRKHGRPSFLCFPLFFSPFFLHILSVPYFFSFLFGSSLPSFILFTFLICFLPLLSYSSILSFHFSSFISSPSFNSPFLLLFFFSLLFLLGCPLSSFPSYHPYYRFFSSFSLSFSSLMFHSFFSCSPSLFPFLSFILLISFMFFLFTYPVIYKLDRVNTHHNKPLA